MKTRLLLLLLACLMLPAAALAQELEVKEFKKPDIPDPAATQYPVKDGNNKTCALVIVGLTADDAVFEGDVVRQERKDNGQYWVYLMEGAQYLEVSAKGYLPKTVQFSTAGDIESLESAQTYYLTIEVPLTEKSFDDLLGDARKYYVERAHNVRFNYYDAAKIAYDRAIEHNDCPFDLRDTLKTERTDVLFLRKYTHHHESACDSVAKYTRLRGADSDEVFKWLTADAKILELILQKHPELTGLQTALADVKARVASHPKSKKTVAQQVTVQKQQVSGTITLDDDLTIPLQTISIYASPVSEVKRDDRSRLQLLGRADAQGRFHVIMPPNMHYIITSAEMTKTADAHYVAPDQTSISIHIK